MALSELQQAILEKVRQRQQQAEVAGTQRTRQALQGFTFGGADEAEAWLRANILGEDYDDALNEIRAKIKAYSEESPVEALSYEVGGAALPAIIGSLFSGGSTAAAASARLFPTIAKVAGIKVPETIKGLMGVSAVQGGLTAMGKEEGDMQQRLEAAPTGAVVGGVTGPVMHYGMQAAGGLAESLIDFARSTFSGRGGQIVEAEIQRIVRESGMTPDEAVQGIVDGTILAENRTIRDIVRGYLKEGGEAGAKIRQTFEPVKGQPDTTRPERLRQAAQQKMHETLSTVDDPNIMRGMKASDAEIRAQERVAYDPFKTIEAPREVQDVMADTIRRTPKALKEVEEAYIAKTGRSPYYTVTETGEVEFNRVPTLAEAESLRRAVKNRAAALFDKSKGVAGEAVEEVEQGLRGVLDAVSPDLAAVRQQAHVVRSARDAYNLGMKALSRPADEAHIVAEELASKSPEALNAYRTGVMAALRNKMTTGARKSTITRLADPNMREGQILRAVTPADELDDVLKLLSQASQSEEAAQRIVQGSQTAITQGEAQRIGSQISAADLAGIDVSAQGAMNLVQLTGKIVNALRPDMSPENRSLVVDILLSENPDLVARAVRDQSGLLGLENKINSVINRLSQGGLRAGAEGGVAVQGLLSTED